jgi:hypothetical protein
MTMMNLTSTYVELFDKFSLKKEQNPGGYSYK